MKPSIQGFFPSLDCSRGLFFKAKERKRSRPVKKLKYSRNHKHSPEQADVILAPLAVSCPPVWLHEQEVLTNTNQNHSVSKILLLLAIFTK